MEAQLRRQAQRHLVEAICMVKNLGCVYIQILVECTFCLFVKSWLSTFVNRKKNVFK